jgi:hypothetical protein
MIPASYLLKQVYDQAWEEPDAPIVVERNRRFFDGLASPLTATITAVLAGHSRSRHPAHQSAR